MASTRRSTRQSTAAAPKYADSESESETPKPKAKQATRRKRARDEDEDVDNEDEDSPPAKKASIKPKPRGKDLKAAAAKSTAIPPTCSETNRDADSSQEVFWLLKAEPLPRIENGVNVAFSIDDLQACKKPEPWSGVRNPQARNNMQAMRKGDLGFFYHSNAKPSGVAGILRVVEEAKVDETAFDPKDPYYDPKSDKEKPKWYCVGVEFVEKFDDIVDLARIKSTPALKDMQLVTNSRLSVNRVRKEEWEIILQLAGKGDEVKTV